MRPAVLRNGSRALAVLGTALVVALPWMACDPPRRPTPIGQRFTDNFDRADLGPEWRETGPGWRIENGALRGQNVHNHPLWLRRKLPRDARIEFDAWSESPAGDLKCEAWGDGESFARQASYTATSYVIIFGGWFNRLNVIARMDEHAPDRRVRQGPRVEPNRHYHFTIERRGRLLKWAIDGEPMLEWDDPDPLAGPGHEHFAFNDWEALVHFDNLVITPL